MFVCVDRPRSNEQAVGVGFLPGSALRSFIIAIWNPNVGHVVCNCMMNTQTSPFRWLAALLSLTMLFGVVGPLVQHACAMDVEAPAPVSHCDERAPSHGTHADVMDRSDASDEAPMSDCAETGMDCCSFEAHAADRVRVDLRSSERVGAAALALVVLTGVDRADDAAHVPLPPDDVVPDRPVRLHLWTATFLN